MDLDDFAVWDSLPHFSHFCNLDGPVV